MADFIHKEGSGAIFRQQKKTDKAPDWKGEIMIAGNLYELAAWEKNGNKGMFLGLSAQVKGAYKPKSDAPFKPEHKANVYKGSIVDMENDPPF